MALYAFDGTWNEDTDDNIQDTNVVRFAELYKSQLPPHYIEGVGTRFRTIGKILGGLFGLGGRTRVDEMYEALCRNWQEGDKVIDIIGFSRGAALAVHFANRIGKEGVRCNGGTEPVKVRFLGLWDVVASFGLSFDTFINFQEINLGWNIETVHKCVEHCFHAMALDERRETFNVTRLNPDQEYKNIREVWFRGVHSGIGGGNENVPRSNIALQWMLEQAASCGLPINKTKAELPRYSKTDRFAPVFENTDVQIDERRKVFSRDEIHPTARPFILNVGEAHTCRVFAELKYNWSGIRLVAGSEYVFSVPDGATWEDGDIICGPAGWASDQLPWYKKGVIEALEKVRRLKKADWFALVGAYNDEEDTLFLIGDGTEPYKAIRDADLYLFANDMPLAYGNNKGSLLVTITRVA